MKSKPSHIGGAAALVMGLLVSVAGGTAQEDWRLIYFGTTANVGNAENGADPDWDGLNNLLEFAFGLHPLQPSAGLAPQWQPGGGNLVCSFAQPPNVAGITYGAEWSSTMDPGSWQPLADTGTALQHTFSLPMSGSGAKFVRLKIISTETPPPLVPSGFALIPAGPFQMGDQSSPLVGLPAELPVHEVQVSAFYLGKYEVTKEEWDAVQAWGLVHGYPDLPAGNGTYASKGANHPVHSITWFEMVKWCNARSEMEGLTPCYTVASATYKTGSSVPDCNWNATGYRLPTEAEWEKAARGGAVGKNFPWGTDTISHSQANYEVRSSNGTTNDFSYDVTPRPPGTVYSYFNPTYEVGAFPFSAPVGSFAANGYGLYDVAGNMLERCWDWHGSYAAGFQTDPRGAAAGPHRVCRGGGWYNYDNFAHECRTADRYNRDPMNRDAGIGFRAARSSVP